MAVGAGQRLAQVAPTPAFPRLARTFQTPATRSGAASGSPTAESSSRSLALLGVVALSSVGFRMLPLEIEPRAHSALAIGMFMICSWMTQVLDHGIAGILGCFLFWMFGIVTFETAFSGFADTTPW